MGIAPSTPEIAKTFEHGTAITIESMNRRGRYLSGARACTGINQIPYYCALSTTGAQITTMEMWIVEVITESTATTAPVVALRNVQTGLLMHLRDDLSGALVQKSGNSATALFSPQKLQTSVNLPQYIFSYMGGGVHKGKFIRDSQLQSSDGCGGIYAGALGLGFGTDEKGAYAPALIEWVVKRVDRIKCCMGVASDMSNQTLCVSPDRSKIWGSGMYCDNYMKTFCEDPANAGAPECSCLSAPNTAFNPSRVDVQCGVQSGYLTTAMKALKIDGIVDCDTQKKYTDSGRQISTSLMFEQNCSGGGSTTVNEAPAVVPPQLPSPSQSPPSQSPPPQSPPSSPPSSPPLSFGIDPMYIFIAFALLIMVIVFVIALKSRARPQYQQYSQPQYQQYPQQQPQQ